MSQKVTIDGLRELDAALADLAQSTAKAVARRTLIKAAAPLVEAARAAAPVDTGELRDSIRVGTKLSRRHAAKAKAELAAAYGDARAAVEVYVGPKGSGKAMVQEFGSHEMPPQAYMRPAWASQQQAVLDNIKAGLAGEIDKAVARAARKAARLKARG